MTAQDGTQVAEANGPRGMLEYATGGPWYVEQESRPGVLRVDGCRSAQYHVHLDGRGWIDVQTIAQHYKPTEKIRSV